MTDFIKLGMMKAEFDAACKAIDERARQASTESLKSAWQALLDNNLTKRDRACDKAAGIADLVVRAKTEAWLRIGEKHGFSRDDAERLLANNRLMN